MIAPQMSEGPWDGLGAGRAGLVSGYTGELIITIVLKYLIRRGLFDFLTKDSIINIDHTCYVQDIEHGVIGDALLGS